MATLFGPVARLLERLNISPNAVTIFGAVVALSAGIMLALGYWEAAIVLIVISGLFDGLDGLLARQANRASPFGAFLDSVLDRWSDSALFCGLLIWHTRAGLQLPAVLAAVALATSLMVSYVRARAEGIGARCNRGLFTRLERILSLLAGLILNQLTIALAVIALLSGFTVLQRMYHTYKYVRAHPQDSARK
jgi:CDP-diacylglycerol--glycerol-3-phosphate 3-phosphatidyltransferase